MGKMSKRKMVKKRADSKGLPSGMAGTILIAEDDDEDFCLTERTFNKLRLTKKIIRVKNGQELMDTLRKDPFPDLVLLDLNMPIKDGREALQEIKSDAYLKRIPVVVLTTSNAEEEITQAYQAGVNSFIRKPFRHKELSDLLSALSHYWFDIVELPRGDGRVHD